MTVSAVRTKFQTLIFDDESVRNISPNAYFYDVTQASATEVAKFYHDTQINFFTCLISFSRRFIGAQLTQTTYFTRVRYYNEIDVAGLNYNVVIDTLETIDALVISALGETWGSTVDYYQPQVDEVQINRVILDEREVWLGEYSYTGFKTS